ncbi:MAG TPA: MFS transporter [Steroidobacteraceae bacterium]|nr:MFS transporter [Steroidobacteraceae bacterium]
MNRIREPEIAAPGPTDIGPIIDGARFGSVQISVFVLALLCMTFEGYDTYAVSYIGPTLLRLWHLSTGTLAVIFTAGTVGSALGYLAIGPLADRFGRYLPVVVGTAVFGALSILSSSAAGSATFILWRILVGLALGAVLPNIVAIATEITPLRRRSLVVVVLYSGFAIGSALAGLITGRLLPVFGWGSVLWVGGGVPLLLSLAMWRWLPESPRFMTLRDPRDPRLPGLLWRLAGDAGTSLTNIFTLQGEHLRRQPIRDLFVEGRALSTLAIWLVLSMDVTTIAALVFWIPTLLNTAGQTAAQGINFSVVLLLGGIVGAFVIGWCMDRFGTYRILIPAHLCATLFIVAFALLVKTSPVAVAFLIGLTLNGGTSGSQGLLARLYPTSLRTTGVGWASAVSRMVGVAQPLFLGVKLASGWTPTTTLMLCSVPTVISLIALSLLSRDRFGIDQRAAGSRHRFAPP